MFRGRILVAVAVALAVSIGAVDAQRLSLSENAITAAKDANVFAYKLYSQIKDGEKGNLFFSPYSISSALAMTYGGARGETADQMAETLNFNQKPQLLHPAMGDLVRYLNATGKNRRYQLSVANALWGQEGFEFNPDYIKLVKDNYHAQLAELNFKQNAEAARLAINDWVEKKTNDKIKDLLPKGALHVDTRLVLTNAIYFKSAWYNNFSERATKPEPFTTTAGKKYKIPMMRKSEKIAYIKNDLCQAVNIPYQGYGLSMIVLLPNKTDGLAGLESKLNAKNVNRWIKSMKPHQVDLKLPKFKMTSQFGLGKVLSKMGMPLAFTKRADFSGMSTQAKLMIDKVIHKAFVDVHEKGTEAAAATAVTIKATSAPLPAPLATFYADHPFVFVIRENRTGSILFLGRASEPKLK